MRKKQRFSILILGACLTLLAVTHMDAVGAGLKRAARLVVSMGGSKQGNAYDLDFATLFTVDCTTTPGRCSLTPSSSFFTESDTTVPLSMSALPGTGGWTITTGVITANADDIQITDDPDTDNDVARKKYADDQDALDVAQTKYQPYCFIYESPTNNTTYAPYIDGNHTITVNSIDCLAIGGGTIDIKLEECTNAGASCGSANSRVDESIADCTTTLKSDDGTIANGTGITDAIFKLTLSGLSGTVDNLTVCMWTEFE